MADYSSPNLSRLPAHLLSNIFVELDIGQLLACECVCRAFFAVVNSASFLATYTERAGLTSDSNPPPLSSTDRLIVAELRSLRQTFGVRPPNTRSTACLDRLIALSFKHAVWTEAVSREPIYGRPKLTNRHREEICPPGVPCADRTFWLNFFAAHPHLGELLTAHGAKLRDSDYNDVVWSLDHDAFFGPSAPPSVRDKYAEDRRVRVEMLVFWAMASRVRYAIAVCTFADRSWATVCVRIEVEPSYPDNYSLLRGDHSVIAWSRDLLTPHASADTIRLANEPVFAALTEAIKPLCNRDSDDYDVEERQDWLTRHYVTDRYYNLQRWREAIADFVGADERATLAAVPVLYDEARKAAIVQLREAIETRAKGFAARLERGRTMAQIGRLKLVADSLVQTCINRTHQSDRADVMCKPLAVAFERAMRRLVSRLVIERVSAVFPLVDVASPVLAYLALLDDVASKMLVGHRSLPCKHLSELADSLCVHRAMPAIWPLSVVRLAHRLTSFAAQLVSFELLASEQAVGSYAPAHVERITRIGADMYGVVFDAQDDAHRLSERCRLL